MSEQTFIIHGMHCEACTKLSAKRIMKIDDVLDAAVDLKTKTATVQATRPLSTTEINAVLIELNYRAEETK